MKTSIKSIVLVIIFTIIAAISQLFLKIGAKGNFINLSILFGLILYGVGTLIFIIALKGGELSVLYPIISLGFVWVALISRYYLDENLSILQIIGIGSIIFGVSLLGIKR